MTDTTLAQRLRQQSKLGPINVPRAAMREAAVRIETDASTITRLTADNKALTAERDEAKCKLFPYADATSISGMSWNGFYLIGDKKSVNELKRIEHRSAQLEQFAAAYDADCERISAELAEARADYLNASRDASILAGKLNAAEAVIERALESLCGDYPSMAADFRSFLASKEGDPHAE